MVLRCQVFAWRTKTVCSQQIPDDSVVNLLKLSCHKRSRRKTSSGNVNYRCVLIKANIAVRGNYLNATGNHISYGITVLPATQQQ